MTKCDLCKDTETDKPNSIVIAHWSKREVRVLACDECTTRVISNLIKKVENASKS
jgi:hypothetical protein